MLYYPGHFHGLSHEQDMQWMINLPLCRQVFRGDGKQVRFRLKHEARKLASLQGWRVRGTKTGLTIWKISNTDSREVIIYPAMAKGIFTMEYHYTPELP